MCAMIVRASTSVRPSIHPSIHIPSHPFIHVSIYPFIHPRMHACLQRYGLTSIHPARQPSSHSASHLHKDTNLPTYTTYLHIYTHTGHTHIDIHTPAYTNRFNHTQRRTKHRQEPGLSHEALQSQAACILQ